VQQNDAATADAECPPQITIPGESHFVYKIARMRAIGLWPSGLSRKDNRQKLIGNLKQLLFRHQWEFLFDQIDQAVRDPAVITHGKAFQAIFESYRSARNSCRRHVEAIRRRQSEKCHAKRRSHPRRAI
jgi:hypothetical protein